MPTSDQREYQREYQYKPKRAEYRKRYMYEYHRRPEVAQRRRERYALKKARQVPEGTTNEGK
jgi:hypothetical protein